jgi:prepilin-type N-terminal cleavage/methylation domain-containing protein
MKVIHKNHKGLTLVELLVALAIFGVISGATNAVIIQMTQSSRTSAHMVAIRQAQSAAYRVNCDALQAQVVIPGSESDGGFPLVLNWTVWDTGEAHSVTYNLVNPSGDIYELQREDETSNGTLTTIVGQYIYRGSEPPRQTNCSWSAADKVFTLNITTMVGQEVEERTYKIKPRPLV